jgi:hypothetical protein
LAVFHGALDTARLSHYFLPGLLVRGERVFVLDGANRSDPRLLARFARERGLPFEQFSRRVKLARAFTCFQLTELVVRLPVFLRDFPARVVLVTALPDLYFDEDISDWAARAAFERAVRHLGRYARQGLSVAVFSEETEPVPAARKRFWDCLAAQADQVWRFERSADGRVAIRCQRPAPALEA